MSQNNPRIVAIIYGMADSERRLLDLYPKHVQQISDIEGAEAKMQQDIKAESRGLFARLKRWRSIRQYKKFEKNRDSLFHPGARGENLVIEKLSELCDQYHVLCGIRIELPHFISYDRKKNLKSAQIDFAVVSKKGVFVIEVKNWSDSYVDSQRYFSPHEQAGRAGRLLWHVLKSWQGAPRVTSVVLSVRGNIKYDPKYKTVFCTSIKNINRFLENQKDTLSDREVRKIIRKLRCHAPKKTIRCPSGKRPG